MLVRFDLVSFLIDLDIVNEKGYYRYMGSYSSQPCDGGVLWTIFNQTISISENQVKILVIFKVLKFFPNFLIDVSVNR
jgi:carbonic anhydrase